MAKNHRRGTASLPNAVESGVGQATFPGVKVSCVASSRDILDTGPFVAFANAADEHHLWAREVLDALGEAPATCEIVLAEACYLLANSQRAVDLVLALPQQGRVMVECDLMTSILACRLGLLVFLLAVMDFPFRGEFSVGPDSFELIYSQLMAK